MQRWRTRHDVRGICRDIGALLAAVPDFTGGALDDFFGGAAGGTTPFTGLGDLSGLPALGAGGMGAAVNTGSGFNPMSILKSLTSAGGGGGGPVYQSSSTNPTITSTANANSPFATIIDPTMVGGSGGNANAGGGGPFSVSIAKGGPGGSNSLLVNSDPTYNLSSNLPAMPGLPTQPNLIQGGVGMNAMTRPNMMPIPQMNSPMGMTMSTPYPIAAGGVSPMFAGMTAMQQQQQYPGGQQIIPGTASQTGGYDQPQQQVPMPGFPPMSGGMPGMPQMPMMSANAMGIPMPGGGMMTPQIRPSAQPGNIMTAGGQQVPFSRATASNQPLTAGSQQNTAPSPPITQEAQDNINDTNDILNKIPDEVKTANSGFIADVSRAIEKHHKDKQLARLNHDNATRRHISNYVEHYLRSTPEGSADNAAKTADAMWRAKGDPANPGTLTPIQQSIARGMAPQGRGSVHPKWRLTGDIAEMMLGDTGIGKALRAVDKMSETASEKRAVIDRENAAHFITQVNESIKNQDANLNAMGTSSAADVVDAREAMKAADDNLTKDINTASAQNIKPEELQLKGQAEELKGISQIGTEQSRGANDALKIPEYNLKQRNTAADESRATSAASNASVTANKFRWEQAKDVRDYPGVRSARAQKENLDLTNQIASLKNQGAPAEFTAPLKIKLLQNEGQLPTQYSTAQLQQVFERVKSGIVKAEALAARGIDIKALQDAYR